MNENLKALLKAASEDDELMEQALALMGELSAASDETRPEVIGRIVAFVAFARDRGFDLAEEDLVVEAPAEGEVSDEELMVVSGGCGGCSTPQSVFDSCELVHMKSYSMS